MAKSLYREEKTKMRLDGWFLSREIVCNHAPEMEDLSRKMRAAKELVAVLNELSLSISDSAIFASSQATTARSRRATTSSCLTMPPAR